MMTGSLVLLLVVLVLVGPMGLVILMKMMMMTMMMILLGPVLALAILPLRLAGCALRLVGDIAHNVLLAARPGKPPMFACNRLLCSSPHTLGMLPPPPFSCRPPPTCGTSAHHACRAGIAIMSPAYG
jgi:hypothetical protein